MNKKVDFVENLIYMKNQAKNKKGGVAMNKGELVSFVASKAGITKAQARAAVNAVIEGITKGIKENGKVQLVGFGTFKIVERKERTGIDPRTKKKIKIPAKKVVKFSPGRDLKI